MTNRPALDGYVDVAERIGAFKAKYPEGSLQAEIVELTEKRVIIRAFAFRSPEDTKPGVGTASESIPGATSYTRGSEIMVCETSAWGRAIAALGFEVKRGIATREEIQGAADRAASADAQVLAAAKAVFSEPAPSAPAPSSDAPVDAGSCPVHGLAWVRKQGTAKASGKPYDFYSCPAPKDPQEGFCQKRPSFAWENMAKMGAEPAAETTSASDLENLPF
ncbi:hypothetical protein UFOVP613_44 [uncultured Caudovirales phage]|uniref:Uncharacterized protein n=1 Tax=uncultured Caudovirales phage TaxID=2100421 RepID=A0A6J5N793_9CAUD|nr:hypothetical protein UFOVP613_44 [uncultured Caudovirales phage]